MSNINDLNAYFVVYIMKQMFGIKNYTAMKKLLTNITLLIVLIFMAGTVAFGQEYDDIYFRKKDRVKKETKQEEIAQKDISESNETEIIEDFDRNANPDALAFNDNSEDLEDEYFEEDYERQDLNNINPDNEVVVRHYYYNYPASRYYSSFDAIFWSDPYLYQGTMYDPFYDPFYRSSYYYRPGWSFNVGFGYRNCNYYNGWRYNHYSYWGWVGAYSYYDPWYGYYDPYWYPPSYYNRNVVVINNYEGNYQGRGIVRGRRDTRSSIYDNGRVSSRTSNGRSANYATNGRTTNGRVDNSTTNTRTRNSTAVDSNESNYSRFSRAESNSNSNTRSNYSSDNSDSRSRNSTGTVTTPSRTESRSNSYNSRSSRSSTYSSGNTNSRSNSSTYRSSGSNSRSSSYNSSSSNSSRSSSVRSSGSSSRSSGSSRSSSSSSSSRRKKD